MVFNTLLAISVGQWQVGFSKETISKVGMGYHFKPSLVSLLVVNVSKTNIMLDRYFWGQPTTNLFAWNDFQASLMAASAMSRLSLQTDAACPV